MTRGSPYSDEARAECVLRVCELMRNGQSLLQACKEVGVPKTTVLSWVDRYDGVREEYELARDQLIDYRRDEMLEIVDSCEETTESVQKARLRYDARRWELSKIMPRRFGDKVALEHTGKDGGAIEVSDARERIAGKLAGLAAARGSSEADS